VHYVCDLWFVQEYVWSVCLKCLCGLKFGGKESGIERDSDVLVFLIVVKSILM
jgi:hypothetical protein